MIYVNAAQPRSNDVELDEQAISSENEYNDHEQSGITCQVFCLRMDLLLLRLYLIFYCF